MPSKHSQKQPKAEFMIGELRDAKEEIRKLKEQNLDLESRSQRMEDKNDKLKQLLENAEQRLHNEITERKIHESRLRQRFQVCELAFKRVQDRFNSLGHCHHRERCYSQQEMTEAKDSAWKQGEARGYQKGKDRGYLKGREEVFRELRA